MANNNQEVQRLLGIIGLGKPNAMHAGEIAKKLGYPTDGNQVETRKLIRYAIQKGNVILSSTKSGYWRSKDEFEIKNYIKALLERAKDIELRSKEIKAAWDNIDTNI